VWMVGEVGVGFYNGNPLLLVWIVDVKCRHPIWRGLKRGRWGGLGGTNCGDGVMKCIQTFTIVLQDVLSARRHSLLCCNTSCPHAGIQHCDAIRLDYHASSTSTPCRRKCGVRPTCGMSAGRGADSASKSACRFSSSSYDVCACACVCACVCMRCVLRNCLRVCPVCVSMCCWSAWFIIPCNFSCIEVGFLFCVTTQGRCFV
jgi:hypothetical protein